MGWYKEYKEQYWVIEFTRDVELGGFKEGRAQGWKKLCIARRTLTSSADHSNMGCEKVSEEE